MSVTDLTSIRASAVPAVPRTISATQRLAALNLAADLIDYADDPQADSLPFLKHKMKTAARLLNEIASDAKGER